MERYIVFHNDLAVYQETKQALDKQYVKFCKWETTLGEGIWIRHNMKEVCPFIKWWDVKLLELRQNKHPTILIEIKEVMFNRLIGINLEGNKIESVEGLNRIRMPKIKKLWIGQNYISDLNDLRKVYWPEFIQINLGKNNIKKMKTKQRT